MRTKEAIQADMAPLYRELHELEEVAKEADAKRVLGRCYKYLNSYGGDREKWWLYARVIGYDYWPKTFSFQITSENEIIIKQDKASIGMGKEGNGYMEIPLREFERAWKQVVSRINKGMPKVGAKRKLESRSNEPTVCT